MPVPIGPGLPCRDDPSKFEYYCQVMLTLFKPWQRGNELHEGFSTWELAFNALKITLSDYHLQVIDNIQIMHECKDNHDADYAQ